MVRLTSRSSGLASARLRAQVGARGGAALLHAMHPLPAPVQGGGLAADTSGALWAISPDAAGNIYSVNPSTGGAVLTSAVNTLNGAGFTGFAIDAPSRCGPPTISITSGPQSLTNDPTPTFNFSVAVPGAALQCGFDSALAPCDGRRTHARTAKFRFSSSEGRSTFKCKLDRGRLRPCKSPRIYRRLRPGSHRFRVVATDRAGHKDATPAGFRFRVLR